MFLKGRFQEKESIVIDNETLKKPTGNCPRCHNMASWLDNAVGRALHSHRRGYGLESR